MSPLYKYLNADGSAIYGKGKWSLPTVDGPGEWMPPIEGDLIPCVNGYHAFSARDIGYWSGEVLYELEYKGEAIRDGNKVVVREARLLRRMVCVSGRIVPHGSPEHREWMEREEKPALARYVLRESRPSGPVPSVRFASPASIEENLRAIADHWPGARPIYDATRGEVEMRLKEYAARYKSASDEMAELKRILDDLTDLLYTEAGWEKTDTGGYQPA